MTIKAIRSSLIRRALISDLVGIEVTGSFDRLALVLGSDIEFWGSFSMADEGGNCVDSSSVIVSEMQKLSEGQSETLVLDEFEEC